MAVHPHSSGETFFIFCVGQSLITINAFRASMANQGIPIKPLIGSYQGTTEHSFIARMSDYRHIEPWLNDEESILHIHDYDARDNPRATLLYLKEGTEIDLGRMYPVSREEALAEHSWTYDPVYQRYFVCRG